MKDKFLSWLLVLLAWPAILTIFVFTSYPMIFSFVLMAMVVPEPGTSVAKMGYLGITVGFLVVELSIGWTMGSIVYRLAKVNKRQCLIAVRFGAVLMLLLAPVFTIYPMRSYPTPAPPYTTYIENFWSECCRFVQPVFGPVVSSLFPRRDTTLEQLFYWLLAVFMVLAGTHLIYWIFRDLLPWWRKRR